MSAVLQLWSHTKTLKASSIIISFNSMTSESAGGGGGTADRTHVVNVRHPAVGLCVCVFVFVC